MSDQSCPDWDPRSDEVFANQCSAQDEMRTRCPVAYSDFLGWSVFRHRDVLRVLFDPATFSNVVSSQRSVPNGMDPPEHTAYRRLIEPYFAPERMQAFEPQCREIATKGLASLSRGTQLEFVSDVAMPFALRCQCAFLGWPETLAAPIVPWTQRSHAATLAGDRTTLKEVAHEFASHVGELLAMRRRTPHQGSEDALSGLLEARVNGRPLTEDELVSVLRNWTVGEVGSIAMALGIVMHRLAIDPPLQTHLRRQPALIPKAIEEILRITGPLVANRRLATRDVELGGRNIKAGDLVSVIWTSANRDPHVFENPSEVRLDREPRANLLYGAGLHVCPGKPLAQMELRVAVEEILTNTSHIALAPGIPPEKAVYPANGFSSLSLVFA